MKKFTVKIGKFFGNMDEDKKRSFKEYFISYVRNYAPNYEEDHHIDADEIQLSEVWRYMKGTFEFTSVSEKLSLEELACNIADEVKDQVLAIS